jgi:hypothetical protein
MVVESTMEDQIHFENKDTHVAINGGEGLDLGCAIVKRLE